MMSSSVHSDFAEILNCVSCCFELAAVGLLVYRTTQLDPVVQSEQLTPLIFFICLFIFFTQFVPCAVANSAVGSEAEQH